MSRGPGAAAVGPWHAVGADGLDPATGRPPGGPGASSPAVALATVPVAAWPLTTVTSEGRTVGVAEALGPGGRRVAELLDRLAGATAPPADLAVRALLRATPAGPVDLPVAVVELEGGVRAAGAVDRAWMAAVEERRSAPRSLLAAKGREMELEAALNLAMLLATEALDGEDDGVGARVASGARLWLLGAAVGWTLLDGDDPFSPWAELVSFGLWPIGPAGGRLVLCAAGRSWPLGNTLLVAADR